MQRTLSERKPADENNETDQVTRLFSERLQAYKHACGYLEDYFISTEKMQHQHSKEYEKVMKVKTARVRSLGGDLLTP